MLSTLLAAAILGSAKANSIGVGFDSVAKKPFITAVGSDAAAVSATYTNTTEGWFYLDINADPSSVASEDDRVQAMRMVS